MSDSLDVRQFDGSIECPSVPDPIPVKPIESSLPSPVVESTKDSDNSIALQSKSNGDEFMIEYKFVNNTIS